MKKDTSKLEKEINCCINCQYLDILPDEPESFKYDCFYPLNQTLDGPQYYWDPYRKNNCKYFLLKDF